jgi:hypothetical protein
MRRRTQTVSGRRTPQPPTSPPEPKPTASEHAFAPEAFASEPADWDGFGKGEVDEVDGIPLVVLYESAECARDGCDYTHTRRMRFTTHTLSDDEETTLRAAAHDSTDAALAEYVASYAERTDMETITVDGIHITAENVEENRPSGPCYGHVDEATRRGI